MKHRDLRPLALEPDEEEEREGEAASAEPEARDDASDQVVARAALGHALPSGRGAVVVARALRRLNGQRNAAVARAAAARERDEAAPEGAAAEPEADKQAPANLDAAREAVAAHLAAIGEHGAERVVAGVGPDSYIAVADLERHFLVLEISRTPGSTETTVTRSRQAARVGIVDHMLDGFASNSDALPGGGEIATAADELVAHPQATATIEGFTDDVGKPAANESLSTRRAERAREAIIAAAPDELTEANFHIAGRGATEFVAPNDIEPDRRRNRRVRIRVEEPAP